MRSVLVVSLVLASSLVQAHSLWGCCPDVEPKQPKKCGEHIPFNRGRNLWRAGAGEFPFLADIEIKLEGAGDSQNKPLANCSGAILSKQDILTSIKCVRNKSGEQLDKLRELKVFVGSLYQNKYGEQVAVRKILEKELELSPDECAKSNVPHGLALLKLVEPMKFRFEKPDPSKPKQKPKFINSACFKEVNNDQIEPNHVFQTSQFVGGDSCAKAFEFELRPCPMRDDDEMKKVNCAILVDGPADLSHGSYQEGAPLVELNTANRWQVAGIISKDVDLWGICEPNENEDPKLTKFVPLYNESIKKWLEKGVLQTP